MIVSGLVTCILPGAGEAHAGVGRGVGGVEDWGGGAGRQHRRGASDGGRESGNVGGDVMGEGRQGSGRVSGESPWGMSADDAGAVKEPYSKQKAPPRKKSTVKEKKPKERALLKAKSP